MSAPLRLTSGDLRHLADALDELTLIHEKHRVLPGSYSTGLGYTTESGDDVNLELALVDGTVTIADRYGS